MDRIRSENIGEAALKELGHLIFNNMVDERENAVRQWRSPSWCERASRCNCLIFQELTAKIGLRQVGSNYNQFTRGQAHTSLGLGKDINYIPNPTRRYIALFQAYFMVRLLIVTCGDCFFENYANTMRRMPDSRQTKFF
jgi:hypothetical protein